MIYEITLAGIAAFMLGGLVGRRLAFFWLRKDLANIQNDLDQYLDERASTIEEAMEAVEKANDAINRRRRPAIRP